jgi:hypothetical protein
MKDYLYRKIEFSLQNNMLPQIYNCWKKYVNLSLQKIFPQKEKLFVGKSKI